MAAQNDVLDLEVDDGVLDDGGRVDVGPRDDVGNVAVDKDVSGLQAEDGCLGAAGVGAAEPDCERDLEVRKKKIVRESGGATADDRTICRFAGLPEQSEIGRKRQDNVRIWGACPLASFGKKLGF